MTWQSIGHWVGGLVGAIAGGVGAYFLNGGTLDKNAIIGAAVVGLAGYFGVQNKNQQAQIDQHTAQFNTAQTPPKP